MGNSIPPTERPATDGYEYKAIPGDTIAPVYKVHYSSTKHDSYAVALKSDRIEAKQVLSEADRLGGGKIASAFHINFSMILDVFVGYHLLFVHENFQSVLDRLVAISYWSDAPFGGQQISFAYFEAPTPDECKRFNLLLMRRFTSLDRAILKPSYTTAESSVDQQENKPVVAVQDVGCDVGTTDTKPFQETDRSA